MAYLLFLVLCSCLLHATTGHDSTALTFELPDNEQQCFYHRYKEGKRLTLYYEVIRGGNKDVDFVIESPNGLEIYKGVKKGKDEVNFESSYGVYSFCFSNEFSTFSHKVVYFELRPEGHETLADRAGQKKSTANTLTEETMDHIYRNTKAIQSVQNTFRIRESYGRVLAENLSKRVSIWSIGEAVVILLMGLGQVFVLRRFFSHIHPPAKDPKVMDLPKQSLTA